MHLHFYQAKSPAVTALALFVLCALATSALFAQTYPNRPIRFVTAAAGGGNDVSARIIAHGLTERFGQQVIVDNRGGAHVPANTVAKAAPDGYTILLQNNTIWIAPLLEKTAYDHFRELTPITITARAPNVLVWIKCSRVRESRSNDRELMSAGIGAHVDAIITLACNIRPHVEFDKRA